MKKYSMEKLQMAYMGVMKEDESNGIGACALCWSQGSCDCGDIDVETDPFLNMSEETNYTNEYQAI